METRILEKAAQQLLCEKLGFDEGRFYYSHLVGKGKEMEEGFSYSKKYRMFKNLFMHGAVIKCRDKGDMFTYQILPPYFLSLDTKDKMIAFLEKKYDENYPLQEKEKIHLIASKDNSVLFYLLKRFMINNATIQLDKKEIEQAVRENFGKEVKTLLDEETKMIYGKIDNKYSFEFARMKILDKEELIGHISKID